MRPSRFTEEQIVQALRQVSAGTPAVKVCRTLGITQTTFYRWRSKFGDVGNGENGEAHQLRELRDENHKLKLMVANLLLEKQRLADARRAR